MSTFSVYTLGLSGLILVFSIIAFLVNQLIFHYIGNNYFPDHMLFLVGFLILLNMGSLICFKKENKYRTIGIELFYFLGVMSLIALATNAVQLTPFPPIDQAIVTLENYFHIQLKEVLVWTHNHPQLMQILVTIYDSLPYQMSIIPLILIFSYRIQLLREYYFLLLCTTLLGFSFYYFFPTTAPASIIDSPLFSQAQQDTGLKFNQLHHYIIPITNDGGLIAFPSFHTIWAILCVYLLQEWVIPCLFLLGINILLLFSCVLLGWHYPSDILGGFIVLFISYYLMKRIKNHAPYPSD